MDNITNLIGTAIRDTLKSDATFLSIIGVSSGDAYKHIFFTRPAKESKPFDNPRVVITPMPSDMDKFRPSSFYVGEEVFQVSLWMNETPFDKPQKALDKIVNLFDQQSYAFTESGKIINFGIYTCSGKFTYPDPDKPNTIKGDLVITLNIGGIKK
jgi:hypothetical protein